IGQSFGCRRPSSDGPASSCTRARRVSSANSPLSPMKRVLAGACAASGACASAGIAASSFSDQFIGPLPQKEDLWNSGATTLVVASNPAYGFAMVGFETMPTAQCKQADNAAQTLCGGELLQHVGNRCLGPLLQDRQHVGLQCSEVDLGLGDQFADRLQVDWRGVPFRHLAGQSL